jgi:adenine-specific DNA-methyltransferase
MNKPTLIQKIKSLEGLTSEERAALIELINTKKKYGLVWEDKPEDVEEQLRSQLPVLIEVPERRILAKDLPLSVISSEQSKPEEQTLFDGTKTSEIAMAPSPSEEGRGEAAPNHILIEGDNLHALTALTFTHEGKIDVIYIDPPYNTGNKDFKYNDSFVDREDTYRHSKWLSFMHKRLEIAKMLLSEKGMILISIDDIEYSQLKLLMDEVFNHNFINSIAIKTSEASGVKMSHTNKKLPKIKEYLLIYSKTSSGVELNPVKVAKVDDVDKFKAYAKYYTKIILNKEESAENWKIIPINEYLKANDLNYDEDEIINFKLENSELIVYRTNNKSLSSLKFETKTALIKSPTGLDYIWWEGKQMLFLSDYINEGLCDLWSDISTINLNKEICELDSFENGQKPLELLKRVQKLYPSKELVILDFFAGSGTTLHATMALNAEDGGIRQCIMVTNNENNICEEVTYERNKRVIQGYTNAKGNWVNGLSHNSLRYYKTNFVGSAKNEQNKRLLTQASTDLLCIKEDCYEDITAAQGFNAAHCRIFTNNTGKYMVVVYHSRNQLSVIEQLIVFIQSLENLSDKVKLYAFSPEKETLLEDFYEVADWIDAVPLPEAIYNAYRATFRTLKLDKKPVSPFEATEALTDTNESEIAFPTQDEA